MGRCSLAKAEYTDQNMLLRETWTHFSSFLRYFDQLFLNYIFFLRNVYVNVIQTLKHHQHAMSNVCVKS